MFMFYASIYVNAGVVLFSNKLKRKKKIGRGVMFAILTSFYKENIKPPDTQPTLVAVVMEYAFDSIPGFILSMCIISQKYLFLCMK